MLLEMLKTLKILLWLLLLLEHARVSQRSLVHVNTNTLVIIEAIKSLPIYVHIQVICVTDFLLLLILDYRLMGLLIVNLQ